MPDHAHHLAFIARFVDAVSFAPLRDQLVQSRQRELAIRAAARGPRRISSSDQVAA